MFDMVATTLMYIGLTMTYASSFQMLRGTISIKLFIILILLIVSLHCNFYCMLFIFFSGAVIIFTAIFSKMFVHRQVSVRHWLGIFTIIIGLITVGVSDLLSTETDSKSANSTTANNIIIGND